VGLESSQPDSARAQPNQAVTWAGRGTLVPWRGDDGLLQVGASGVWRQTQEFIGVTRYRTGDEIHLTGLEFVDTGWIYDVNHIRQGGAELLALKAGWRLQGEYTRTWTMRNTLADLAFDGAYVQLSHLWGARYRYRDDKALVGRVKPERRQAWEAGLRWSWVDMNDLEVAGGSATVWTVGGSWYPDQVVRISVAWLHVDHDEAADGAGLLYGDLDYDAAMVRCRVAF
jgi:phosphate-selective porin OprO/OprP